MNSLIRFFLVVSLLVASTVNSFGAGLNAGAQMMTICSGTGEREAMITASGTEVPAMHDCLDCCISLTFLETREQSYPVLETLILTRFQPESTVFHFMFPELFELARGPPEFG